MNAHVSRRRALTLALAPLAAAALPVPLRAQSAPAPIRCATTGATVFAHPYLAQDLGFFRRAGLNVEITPFPGGQLTITSVVTGNSDIGITTPTQLGAAISHDIPVRMIGYSGQWDAKATWGGLYVTRDSPLRDAKSLEGKTVGVNALSSTNFLTVVAWLTQNGVDPAKVKSIEVPFAEIAAALKRGTIDAGVTTEPFLSASKDELRPIGRVFDSLGTRWSVSCWFSRLDYIRSNGPLLKRVMDAAYESAKVANARHDLANPIISKYSKLPLELVNAMSPVVFAEAPDPAGSRLELEWAYRYKIFTKPLTIEEMMAT
jgi:NitT/TauT family transport system substrate-binding protein